MGFPTTSYLTISKSSERQGGGGRVGEEVGKSGWKYKVGVVGGPSPPPPGRPPASHTRGHTMWSCEKPAALNESYREISPGWWVSRGGVEGRGPVCGWLRGGADQLVMVLKALWGIVAKCTDSVGKRRREGMPTAPRREGNRLKLGP